MSGGFHKLGRISALRRFATTLPAGSIKTPLTFGLGGGAFSAAFADPGERTKAFGKGLLAGAIGGAGFQAGRHYGTKALDKLLWSGPEAHKWDLLHELGGKTGLSGFTASLDDPMLVALRRGYAPQGEIGRRMLEDPGIQGRILRGATAGHAKGIKEGLPAAAGGLGALGATSALTAVAPSIGRRPTPISEVGEALEPTGLEKLKEKLGEFAPGIPTKKPVERLPRITPKTTNRWTVAVQDHEAARAGRHFDLRLVDPDAGKAHSWAIPKAHLPEPGERLLAVQTFTHTPEYALHFGEKKPQFIGKGYGKGRVRMALKEPTDIVEANNNLVRFNVYQGKNNQEYLLRRTKDDKWLIMNTTVTKEKRPDIPQSKPKYKEVEPDKVDVTDDTQLMMAKIDGAHNTFVLDHQKPVRIFSYRPTERATGVIEHTHRFLPGFHARVPKGLDGLVLRGELFAADPHTGRTREAVETGAILNSGIWKSRETQTHSPLRAAIFDVARRNGEDVEEIPYKEKLPILERVHRALPFLEIPPVARTAKEKVDLLNRIRTGQEPITSEGVVLWPNEGGAPIKAKFRPDHDIYVRSIFPETGKREDLAGGFEYSWTPRGKVVGRVGTGLNHDLKRDMLDNPEKYIGRVARVRSQGVYPDKSNPKRPGALRAPSFYDWHLDRNMGKMDE